METEDNFFFTEQSIIVDSRGKKKAGYRPQCFAINLEGFSATFRRPFQLKYWNAGNGIYTFLDFYKYKENGILA